MMIAAHREDLVSRSAVAPVRAAAAPAVPLRCLPAAAPAVSRVLAMLMREKRATAAHFYLRSPQGR